MSHRIGIDLGGTKIEGILLASDGHQIARQRLATPAGDYQGTLHTIKGLVDQLEQHLPQPDQTASVGIGIPGTLSPVTGLVKNANSTCLIGQALDQDLTKILDRPVRLANDANCFTLSEATDGAAAGKAVVFGVIIGTGVGGGIIVNGKPLTGPNAVSGEWGHNPLPWMTDEEAPTLTPDCYCGKRGCIETFLSGPGLIRDFGDPTITRAEEILQRSDAGDAAAKSALQRYEERLARALASIINIIDPDVIVLGGGLSNMARLYQNVPALLSPHVFGGEAQTPIVQNVHGDSSGVRGAAWLWS